MTKNKSLNWYKTAKAEISNEDLDDFVKSKWIPVDSGWIDAIAYYEPIGMLEVKLSNGREYSFANVPSKIFENFMQSSSKGQFFNEVIRKKYSS